jgi:hypothetical protein
VRNVSLLPADLLARKAPSAGGLETTVVDAVRPDNASPPPSSLDAPAAPVAPGP